MKENVEVRPTRRRRHSAEFKAEVLEACLQPGVSIAAVALRYRLNANLVRRWVATQEELDAGADTRAPMTVPSAEFVPLQLGSPASTPAMQDIVIEVRRGATMVTIRWPHSAAAECATWLHSWLR